MRLTIWELLSFLYRHKGKLLLMTVLSAVLAGVTVDRIQTCSAEVVIRYKDACIASGTAPDGTPFDVTELVAPKVIAAASEQLSFPLSSDEVRANTVITPVADSPAVYQISYRGGRSFLDTQDTLDQLIGSYFQYYTEKYIGLAAVIEIDYELNLRGFDYLEQAELLQDNIDQTIRVLQDCAEEGNDRSPAAGVSVQDLIDEFSYLSRFKMPGIYAKIYEARLSKDVSRLIDKYAERMAQHELNAKSANDRAVLAGERMNTYAAASPDVSSPEQTAYDALLKDYIANRILASTESLDAQQCAEMIAIFSSPAEADVDADQYRQDVEAAIAQTLSELEELYAAALALIDDCNARLPQTHIECLTGIRTCQNIHKAPCVLLAAAAGFVLACMAVLAYESARTRAQYVRQGRENSEPL